MSRLVFAAVFALLAAAASAAALDEARSSDLARHSHGRDMKMGYQPEKAPTAIPTAAPSETTPRPTTMPTTPPSESTPGPTPAPTPTGPTPGPPSPTAEPTTAPSESTPGPTLTPTSGPTTPPCPPCGEMIDVSTLNKLTDTVFQVEKDNTCVEVVDNKSAYGITIPKDVSCARVMVKRGGGSLGHIYKIYVVGDNAVMVIDGRAENIEAHVNDSSASGSEITVDDDGICAVSAETVEITVNCYGNDLVVFRENTEVCGSACYAKQDATPDNTCSTLSRKNCYEQQICEWN